MPNKKESLSSSMPKLIMSVVLIVGIGAVLGLVLLSSVKQKENNAVNSLKKEELKSKNISEKRFKNCDEFKSAEKKDCYLNLAKKNRDESFCEKIGEIEFRSMCYVDLAMLKNNPKLCGKATASLASSCIEYFGLKKPIGWNLYVSNAMFPSENYQINYHDKWSYSENRIGGSKKLGRLQTIFKDKDGNVIVEITAGDLLLVYLNDKLYENKGKINYGLLNYEFWKYEEIKTGNIIYVFDTRENMLADFEQEKYNEVIAFKTNLKKEGDFKQMLSTFKFMEK